MKKIISLIISLAMLFSLVSCKKEKTAPVMAPAETTVTLTAVGDNLIHAPIYEQALLSDGNYDFASSYANIADYINGDINILNQETPIGGVELGISSYPCFNSPQELGRDMINLGFNVINHATNHIMDAGSKGVINSLDFWAANNIPVLGVYKDGEDPVKIIERNGLKFGLVSFTYGTNGIRVPEGKGINVCHTEDALITEHISRARAAADIVIVNMHWGNEYQMKPNDEQKRLAALAASCNADLLIGHHPHVIQPIEEIVRADGRMMTVAYSLGNFISSQVETETMLGGMLMAEFKGIPGNAYLSQVAFMPLITHYGNRFKGSKVYAWDDYTEYLASIHGCKNYDSSFSYSYINELINNTIGEKYLINKVYFLN